MIAIVKHIYEWALDTAKFTAAVWRDARAIQAETEAKYGFSGF